MNTILASKLNILAQLQEPVSTIDASGGASVTWNNISTIWVAIRYQRPTESFATNQAQPIYKATISMRQRPDIAVGWRVVAHAKSWRVTSITPHDRYPGWIEVMGEAN